MVVAEPLSTGPAPKPKASKTGLQGYDTWKQTNAQPDEESSIKKRKERGAHDNEEYTSREFVLIHWEPGHY